MRYRLFVFLCLAGFTGLSAQNDSTESVFKKGLRYSYLQYTFGYEKLYFGKKDNLDAFYLSIFGAVFNERLAIGLDLETSAHNKNYIPNGRYPNSISYTALSLNVEPLLRPNKLINFSFPVRFGYATTSRWDTLYDPASQITAYAYDGTPQNIYAYLYADDLLVGSAGVNAFINLWKPLSIGAGTTYRYSWNLRSSAHESDYSGMGVYVIARWKIDTRAYTKKMLERQKEIYQNMQPKS